MKGVELSRKERLAQRFYNWPLIRLLILNVPFRIVFIGVVGLGLGVVLLLPKIWITTPSDFYPVVRVSLLDKLQAMSLKRAAVRAEQKGLYESAFLAWRSAWANDPGDLQALRGLIRSLEFLPDPYLQMHLALQAGAWFLRMTKTNELELAYLARAYVRVGLVDRATEYVERIAQPWSLEIYKIYIVALFKAGKINEISQICSTNTQVQQEILASLKNLDVYKLQPCLETEFIISSLAYVAGFGDHPVDRVQALKLLRSMRENRAIEVISFDAEFILSAYQHDVERCYQMLQELAKIGKDAVKYYVLYWTLLILEGRTKEAIDMVKKVNLVPSNAWEAYQLARIYNVLGLLDEANQLLRSYGRIVGWVIESLVLRGEILLTKERKLPPGEERNRVLDQLREHALRMRVSHEAMERLGGYSYFLEGYAHYQLGALPAAQFAFQNMVKIGINDPKLVLLVCEHLLRLNLPEYAEPLLLNNRQTLSDNSLFLRMALACAVLLKHDEYLLEVAQRLYELEPNNLAAMNDYAAALLLFRKEPEKAIIFTLQVYTAYPTSPPAIINHATALVRNGRAEEAKELLSHVIPTFLSPGEQTQYNFIAFEIEWALKNYQRARYYLEQIDTAQLFPVQTRWLEESKKKFEQEAKEANLY